MLLNLSSQLINGDLVRKNPNAIHLENHQLYSVSNGGISGVVTNIEMLNQPIINQITKNIKSDSINITKNKLSDDITIPPNYSGLTINLDFSKFNIITTTNKIINL
jgi:hypothetical protein